MMADARPDAPRQRGGAAPAGVTGARIAATAICADLRNGDLLDPAFERRSAALDARDRRWLRELVYGMLRRRAWLDAMLGDRVRGDFTRLDPDLVDLLRLGAHQLLHMGSVPAYAAIAQTVELVKRREGIGASRLANAVLRRVDREREQLGVERPEDPLEALALEHSHPTWLVRRWIERWGAEETARLLAANNAEAPLVARPWRATSAQLAAMLEGAGVRATAVPLVEDSLVLEGVGGMLTELGAFRQGLFHLQDPGSTLVTRYAAPDEGSRVADLCAAPGGKSIELARRAGEVWASDVSFERLRRVRENVARLEAAHVHPFVADARMPAVREADLVLIDVPCTGTGTFRRHPDARWRLKAADLAMLGALQRQILRAAAGIVRPGGLLVYSTCSLELEENDEPVDAFLAANPSWRLEPPPAGTVPDAVLDAGRLRVLPQRHGTDGAFAARLRRGA
jgi:16S rRNA (cytosine967-C5)-methyltransferase